MLTESEIQAQIAKLLGTRDSQRPLVLDAREKMMAFSCLALTIVIVGLFISQDPISRNTLNFRTQNDVYGPPSGPSLQRASVGFIDRTGRTVISPQFADACPFSDGIASVRIKNSPDMKYVDRKGSVVVPRPNWINKDPDPHLFSVSINGKYGYQDKSGHLILPPKWDAAYEFVDGVAVVATDGAKLEKTGPRQEKSFLIDDAGQVVFNFGKLKPFGRYSDGLLRVLDPDTNKCGFINSKGKLAINLRTGIYENFSQGRASAKPVPSGRTGIIDSSGRLVVQPIYDLIGVYSEGLASFKLGDNRGYLDKDGKVAIQLPHDASRLGEFHEGLAEVSIGGTPIAFDDPRGQPGAHIGFIDKTGKFIIPPQFSGEGCFEHGFYEGLAAVGVGTGETERFGYIDRTGKFVIQPRFLGAVRFSEGLAAVMIEDSAESQSANLDRNKVDSCSPYSGRL
jgi:WG containing repeat